MWDKYVKVERSKSFWVCRMRRVVKTSKFILWMMGICRMWREMRGSGPTVWIMDLHDGLVGGEMLQFPLESCTLVQGGRYIDFWLWDQIVSHMKHGTMFIEQKAASSLDIQFFVEQYNPESVSHSHNIYFELPIMATYKLNFFQYSFRSNKSGTTFGCNFVTMSQALLKIFIPTNPFSFLNCFDILFALLFKLFIKIKNGV